MLSPSAMMFCMHFIKEGCQKFLKVLALEYWGDEEKTSISSPITPTLPYSNIPKLICTKSFYDRPSFGR
jgi:hypothetical protein